MGTTTVTRKYAACSEAELREQYEVDLEQMAREGGTDAYCGNWNANTGLHIVRQTFPNIEQARAYAERNVEKNDDVLAMKVGDFTKSWPETKAQKALVEKAEALAKEEREFEYHVLARAHKQKSKTKKCLSCESAINVKKIPLPRLAEINENSPSIRLPFGSSYFMGRFMRMMTAGLTDCPVCFKNLLMTETDKKNLASLKKRVQEAQKKVADEKLAYEKAKLGKPQAYWYLYADCGC